MAQLELPVRVRVIAAGKFRRYKHLTFLQHFTVPHVIFGNLRDSTRIIHGFFQSLWILLRFRPDIVFAKGGYVCLPMGVAAWLLRTPLVIHDSDTRPGLTNRLLARFARSIATGSSLDHYTYDRKKSTFIGVPIDSSFTPVTIEQQATLKRQLGVDEAQILVVATGGGLGSAVINHAIIDAARTLSKEPLAFYDIAGTKNYESAKEQSRGVDNIQIVDFIYEGMADVLAAADIVVARGSATFIQELAGIGKAIVLIPARQLGDQLQNAELYKVADAAIVLSDAALATGELTAVIMTLSRDADRRRVLGTKLHAFARPDAARDLATLIVEAAEKP